MNFVLGRGIRVLNTVTTNGNTIYFGKENINWQNDRFIVEVNDIESLYQNKQLIYKFHIIPKPILEKIEREEKERIQDSTKRAEGLRRIKENHPLTVEYYKNRFEKLKELQENLTEKDKKNIQVLSVTNTPIGNRIKEQTFIDETEISIINWLEYLMVLKSDSSELHYEIAFPDTTVWRNLYNLPDFDKLYLNYPTFRYYPVVGITYEQAQRYCIWRGNMVSHYLNEKQKKKYKDYEVIVHYRLPTKEEWEYATLKNDLDRQFGGYSSKRRYTEKEKRKIYRSAKNYIDSTRTLEQIKLDMKNYFQSDTSYKQMFNYRTIYKKPYFDGGFYSTLQGYGGSGNWTTNWVYAYQPTKHFKLYNMFGNVAEMTSEKGIAKGGSFYHTLEECAADKVQVYDSPQAWLGFRCVAEVIVRKKEK